MVIERMDQVTVSCGNFYAGFWSNEYRTFALNGLQTRIVNHDQFPFCVVYVELTGRPEQIRQALAELPNVTICEK